MNDQEKSQSLRNAILCYGMAFLPKLRELTFERRRSLLNEVQAICGEHPLHMLPKPKFVLENWSKDKLSGAQVLTLMILGIWLHMGERKDLCGALIDTWPILEIVKLEKIRDPKKKSKKLLELTGELTWKQKNLAVTAK